MTPITVEITTSLTPESLLAALHKWQQDMNDSRWRGFGWKPPIDNLKLKETTGDQSGKSD
jgi:hypothetical protein